MNLIGYKSAIMLRAVHCQLASKFLFFFFLSATAFSQKTECNKYIPYFWALNAEKLSHRLTNDLSDDSAKVFAIHCWITHNIRYDVKKMLSFNYSTSPVKKILRRRKAICTGYSDLFNELCKYANITSAGVPGYVKNQHVDLNDKFYLDEHIWNAVYLNNEWELVDACWDAGYIKPFRRTLRGFIVYVFSFGRWEILRYKPHFKFYPTDRYYLKDGAEFIIDHVPSDPVWQLLNPNVTIVEAERDSSYYLNSLEKIKGKLPDTELNAVRMQIAAMTPKERDLYDGPVSRAYNRRNHYHIGISDYIKAFDQFNEIDIKSKDTTTVLNQCDSVLSKLEEARLHFDSTIFYLGEQKLNLQLNNKKKNDTLLNQNKRLTASTRLAERNIQSVKQIYLKARSSVRQLNKFNTTRLKGLSRNKSFQNAKPLKVYDPVDSLYAAERAGIFSDSIHSFNNKIANQYVVIDSLYGAYLKGFNSYATGCVFNIGATSAIRKIRLRYYDDLDFEIRSRKDSLMKDKFVTDAMILKGDSIFILKSLFNELAHLKEYYKGLYAMHKLLGNEYVRLKKYHADKGELTALYLDNLAQYAVELAQSKIELDRVANYFQNFRRVFKKQIKTTRYERKEYLDEKLVEISMHSVRTSYINRHYNALSGISKKKLKEISRMKVRIERIKGRFE
jgi:Transglutaminase-like superfamily